MLIVIPNSRHKRSNSSVGAPASKSNSIGQEAVKRLRDESFGCVHRIRRVDAGHFRQFASDEKHIASRAIGVVQIQLHLSRRPNVAKTQGWTVNTLRELRLNRPCRGNKIQPAI